MSTSLDKRLRDLDSLLVRIQDALGTAETGDALVAVARDAHTAEMELSTLRKRLQDLAEG